MKKHTRLFVGAALASLALQASAANAQAVGARRFWGSQSVAAGDSVSNSVTDTAISQSLSIPQTGTNFPGTGRAYTIDAYGLISTTGTPTLTFNIEHFDSTTANILGTSGAITMASAMSSVPFHLQAICHYSAPGSSGTGLCTGQVTFNGNTVAPAIFVPSTATSGTTGWSTVNTSGNKLNYLVLSFQWGTASVSNKVTVTSVEYEEKSPG